MAASAVAAIPTAIATAANSHNSGGGSGSGSSSSSSSSSMAGEVRERFLAFVHNRSFLRRLLLHFCNNRVQEFQDPLTSTLVLMATAPLQMVFCETGLLIFKTNLLPVMQYSLLSTAERAQLQQMLAPMGHEQLHESIESSGQYTLTVLPFTQNARTSTTVHFICKRKLLFAFVGLMQRQAQQGGGADFIVNSTLASIVLQRFWSRVSTPSEIVNAVSLLVQKGELDEKPADDEDDGYNNDGA